MPEVEQVEGLLAVMQQEATQVKARLDAVTQERAVLYERYLRLLGACDVLAQLRQMPPHPNGIEPVRTP
jgi:hypothetical protein